MSINYSRFSRIEENDPSYNLLTIEGNKIVKSYLVNILHERGQRYSNSSFNNLDSAIKTNEDGIICFDRKTREMKGFLLTRNIGNNRENEILMACSDNPDIIIGLIKRHLKWINEVSMIDVVVFVPEKEDIINIYTQCGFTIVKRIKCRFPTEPDIVKMMYYT